MDANEERGVYHFLGNITSHVIHALPLWNQIGGTFLVLSEQAKLELQPYNIPVLVIDDRPDLNLTTLDKDIKDTTDFLNQHAKIVIYYELFYFNEKARPKKPMNLFLGHGNPIKPWITQDPRRLKAINKMDFIAGLGPHNKQHWISVGVKKRKLVDLGLPRNDDVVYAPLLKESAQKKLRQAGVSITKPLFTYVPTFWTQSSVHTLGLDIAKNMPTSINLAIRLHPQTNDDLVKKYLKICKTKPNIHLFPESAESGLNLMELLSVSDALIGDLSSVILDAVLLDKPLLFAYGYDQFSHTKDDYGPLLPIVEYSQQLTKENVSRLTEICQAALHNGVDSELWQKIKQSLFYHYDGTSVGSIEEFIDEQLKHKSLLKRALRVV